MAHFAELNKEYKVLRVIVVSNSDMIDEIGNEDEAKGIEFLKSLFGENTIWVQTSYNSRIRKNFASPDYLYDELKDAFIPPKPSDEYELNNDTCKWEK